MNQLERRMVNQVTLFIMTSLFLLEPVLVSMKRKKRVLYGNEGHEGDRDGYDSFRYYVFLSNEQPGWFWRKVGRRLSPNTEDLACGGSLLTPSIVQTAAHCLATPKEVERYNVSYYRPNNVWENPLYSYVGSNIATFMVDWLKPKEYIIYENTRHIEGTPLMAMYDFGLVLTKNSIQERAPNAPISYAPVYTGASIQEFYNAAVSKEFMCLHIGHGKWNVLSGNYIDETNSNYILWGWRTIMNEIDCENVAYDRSLRLEFYFNYTRDATWVCSQTVKHKPKARDFLYHTGHGDSGGPVTCNNVYFAVVSGGSSSFADHIITYYSPIKYTLFENSAEYRDNMIIYYKGKVPNNLVTTPHPLSLSPRKTLVHYFLLMTVNTFFTLLL